MRLGRDYLTMGITLFVELQEVIPPWTLSPWVPSRSYLCKSSVWPNRDLTSPNLSVCEIGWYQTDVTSSFGSMT